MRAARIIELQEACGVTPRLRRPIRPEEQKIVDWFRAELKAVTDAIQMRRAFLAGVRHGRRHARKQTRRDVEDVIDEMRTKLDDVAPYQNIVVLDPEEPQD